MDNTSDINKPISELTQNALNLKADLVNGQVPSSQLPSYVDGILEYPNLLSFPSEGESGKLYVDLEYNLTYRWSGSIYVEVSKSIALGETDSTAYRGDRGKTAYDHSLLKDNPHSVTKSQVGLSNVDNTSDINKPISTNTQAALNDKADKAITITAGNGLTGGGSIGSNRTIDIVSANDGITPNADNIQLNTIDNLTTTSITKPLSANQGKVLQDNKADKTRKVNAGAGLTGGGDLVADRTIDVVSANDGITVNADNIQLNTIDDVMSTSATKPLSANQGKVLNDKVSQVETDLNLDEYTIAEAFNLLYRKIVSLETIIANGIFKNLQVDNLTTVNSFNYSGAPLIVIGNTAPSSAPDFVGQTYVNTTAPGTVYSAKGVASVSDWKQTSN